MDINLININNSSDIKEKILNYDAIILYQKDEIFKTESLIEEFQKCLRQQNEALRKFIEEREKLDLILNPSVILNRDNNINKRFENQIELLNDNGNDFAGVVQCSNNNRLDNEVELINDNNNNFAAVVQCSNKRLDNQVGILKAAKRKNSSNIDSQNKYKKTTRSSVESLNDSTINKKDTIRSNIIQKRNLLPEINIDAIENLRELYIPEIRNITVHNITPYGDQLFIGGSKGLLLRHTATETLTYDTNTTNVILQIEILTHEGDDRTSLIAFTKGRMIIYEDMENRTKNQHIVRPMIGYIFNDAGLIYVPHREGVIEKLDVSDFKMSHFAHLKHGDVRCFVPAFQNNKLSLMTFKDSRLYKAKKRGSRLQSVELVEGFENIKRVMRVGAWNFLFYSDDTVWLCDSNLLNTGTLTFKEGIKFVQVSGNSVAVVDHDNVLYIHKISEFGVVDQKTCSKTISENITAVCVTSDHVYMSVGNKILIIDYNIERH